MHINHRQLFDTVDYEKRTHQDYIEDALIGTYDDPEFGIRGPTELTRAIMLPDGLPIDYMHLICLGISLLNYWLNSKYDNELFYIGNLKIQNLFKIFGV